MVSEVIQEYIKSDRGTLGDTEISGLYLIGYELFKKKRYQDAQPFFQLLTHLKPENSTYWFCLGTVYKVLKNHSAAVLAFNESAFRDPTNPFIHWHAAESLHILKLKEPATTALKTALKTAKKDVKKYSELIKQLEVVAKFWNEGA